MLRRRAGRRRVRLHPRRAPGPTSAAYIPTLLRPKRESAGRNAAVALPYGSELRPFQSAVVSAVFFEAASKEYPLGGGGPDREPARVGGFGHDLKALHAGLLAGLAVEALRPRPSAVRRAQNADAVVAARGLVVEAPGGRPLISIDFAGADINDVRVRRIERDGADAQDRKSRINVPPSPVGPAGVAPVGRLGIGVRGRSAAGIGELAHPEAAARGAGEDPVGIPWIDGEESPGRQAPRCRPPPKGPRVCQASSP